MARRRTGAAASEARQESALRAAAGGTGPRRSRALRRTRRDRGSDRRGARARRCDLVARDRRRQLRDAGAPRGAGGAHQANSPTASATRWCGAIIARIWPSGCSGHSRRRPAAAAMAEAIILRGRGGESGRRFAPRGSFTPGAAGRFEPRGARSQGSAGSQTINRRPYQVASPQLALSPIMRGQRSAMSRREALILQSLINHPWLLHDHLEEVAALELAHPEAHNCAPASSPPSPIIRIPTTLRPKPHGCGPSWTNPDISSKFKGLSGRSPPRTVWGAQPGAARGGCSFHLAPAGCLASQSARLT